MRRAIRRAPQELQDEALVEVRRSAKKMHDSAKAKLNVASKFAPLWHGKIGMQNITGVFRRNYRWSVAKRSLRARVGVITPAAARKAPQIYWFNNGTVNQPARPFHDEAFEGEREPYIQNQKAALNSVLNKLGFTRR